MEDKVKHESQSMLAETKESLRRLNLRAAKGLGQHFLVDRGVLKKIISAADLIPEDIVVEVGPGLGILTEELLKKAARVIAIEIDPILSQALAQRFSHAPQLTLINDSILSLDPANLMTQHAPHGAPSMGRLEHPLQPAQHAPKGAMPHGYKVVANLPYYIAAPVLRRFLEASLKPARIVVMLQKEVAQSIAAAPGKMGLISVSVQLYGKPAVVDHVPARSFYPRPKVDSAILGIDVYPEPAVKVEDIAGFFTVVKAGFSTPRKQLRNSLAIGMNLPPAGVAEVLEQAGVAPERRPQTLSLEEWAMLYRAFAGIPHE